MTLSAITTPRRVVGDQEYETTVTLTVHDPMLPWLAGLLEGEGHFDAKSCSITLHMCDEDVVRKAMSVAGCGHVYGPLKSAKAHYRPIWAWKVSRAVDSWLLCMLMYEYMGSRRRKVITDLLASYNKMSVGKVRHGTTAQYRKGCRCLECRRAWSDYRGHRPRA